ncbi:hypothetical protein [Microcoleus sp. PH2017_30_WIL_O_A]|nr:hypothetical protein [Microcoleus sp. PH2017_30_WIL_O_A]MCC3582647.1 hypothetical protein [Microcoleus sp. PH2017_30_WIL_O_A]
MARKHISQSQTRATGNATAVQFKPALSQSHRHDRPYVILAVGDRQ